MTTKQIFARLILAVLVICFLSFLFYAGYDAFGYQGMLIPPIFVLILFCLNWAYDNR